MSAAEVQEPQVRAGCYCRISSDPKDKRHGVDRQREDTAIQCEVQRWQVADVYVDNDKSATSGKERPEWDRLIADVKAGKIDAIVVWNQDRGWRKMSDLESLRPILEPRGVRLATTNIGVIDFRNADDVFRAQVSTALSEMEVAKMRVRQKRAARQRAEQGRPKWRQAFGYLPYEGRKEDDKGERNIDPKTAPLVRQAHAALLAGNSLNDICRLFNNAGAYGLNGKPWTPGTVSLFLRAARNAGLRTHNGELVVKKNSKDNTFTTVKGTWEPLVDEATWRAVQAKLNEPGRKKPGRKSVRKHPLTGVLRCGNCGDDVESYLSGQWVMQPTGGKSGRPKAGHIKEAHPGQVSHAITYQCKQCYRCGVRAHHLEPLLQGLVAGRLAKPDAVDLLKKGLHDAAEAEAIRQEKLTLRERLDELAVERAQGLMTGRQLQVATEVIQQRIDALASKETDEERLRVFDGIPLGTDAVKTAVADLSPDRFRAVMALLMKVTVMPKGKSGNQFDPDRVKVEWL